MPDNVDIASNREEFRIWLAENHATERECWLHVRRGRPSPDAFAYLDAVEEALCFGWVDGHLKSFPGLGTLQRFTPRAKGSSWSELNKERVRRLERLGLMTDAGRKCLPAMGPRSFHIDAEIVSRSRLHAFGADPDLPPALPARAGRQHTTSEKPPRRIQ